jgi:5-formyltetrahydrofolate cyclo-ligase
VKFEDRVYVHEAEIAYVRAGYRLYYGNYGGGFYDRLFSSLVGLE